MKKVVPFIMFLLFTLIGCKKEDAQPDFANIIDGTYNVTFYATNGYSITLPKQGMFGTVTFKRVSPAVTTMRVNMQDKDKVLVEQTTSTFLTGQGSLIDLYNDGAHTMKTGSASNSSLEIKLVSANGLITTIKARR